MFSGTYLILLYQTDHINWMRLQKRAYIRIGHISSQNYVSLILPSFVENEKFNVELNP